MWESFCEADGHVIFMFVLSAVNERKDYSE